jgi:prophage antirepressor-like protein
MADINLHQDEHSDHEQHPFTMFDFDGRTVQALIIGGDPWFVRQDVLELLDLRSNTSARSLAPDEKGTHTVRTLGGPQEIALVNEPGLYRLIFQSRKEEAERIKTWVFTEVLPSIRRTGAYARPGALPSGDPVVRELLDVQKEILAVQRERLDIEKARLALARFPEVEDLERGAVRSKLTQLIDVVATVRSRCPALIWRELYLLVKAINGVDLYAQTAAARQMGDRVTSIVQCIETMGLMDMVYRTARMHFQDDILASPAQRRVPQLHVTGPLPVQELDELSWLQDFITANSNLN